MDFENLMNFLDVSKLSMKNRMMLLIIFTVVIILEIICLLVVSNYNPISWVALLTLLSLEFAVFLPIIFYEQLVEKYGGASKIHPLQCTYQLGSVIYSTYFPTAILVILLITWAYNQLELGKLLSIAFIIPFCSLLRTGVFNDSSCYLDDEIVIGYPPHYNILSLIVGLIGLYNAYFLLNTDYIGGLLLFGTTLLFELIIVVPNWFNKVLPIEIRRLKGLIAFLVPTLIVYFVIYAILTGNNFNFPLTLDLTPIGILRKIITYGIGIVFIILFCRQARKMNKK
ncbi:MAG: hypothetical protein IKE95_08660 [Methanobrevibacter sp.]|nr:hypothetical protein [Methanobrevibacter sp.]